MKLNKFIISILLAMCVTGFTMSSVLAKEETFTNIMEVNKTYYVYGDGKGVRTTDDPKPVNINMYRSNGWNYNDVMWSGQNIIWKQCYNPGQDMRTADTSPAHLWNEPVMKIMVINGNVYAITPLKAGDYWTKTQHSSGDKTYHWIFV